MSKRLIYAEDVLQILDRDKAYMSDVGRIHAKNAVNEAPTVEQKKGRMVEVTPDYECPWHIVFVCSSCGNRGEMWYRFCPLCGADMRG